MSSTTQRAYSTIEVRSVSEEPGRRIFVGIATTVRPDRMGDVVESRGVVMQKDTPILWQHDAHDPIGWVRSHKVTDDSIEVTCEIASIEEAGPLKDRLDKAWQMLKAKLVKGLSLGFRSLESTRIDGGIRYLRAEVMEISVVTIPANADCGVLAIRAADIAIRRARGLDLSPALEAADTAGAFTRQQADALTREIQSIVATAVSRSDSSAELPFTVAVREVLLSSMHVCTRAALAAARDHANRSIGTVARLHAEQLRALTDRLAKLERERETTR